MTATILVPLEKETIKLLEKVQQSHETLDNALNRVLRKYVEPSEKKCDPSQKIRPSS